MMRWSSLPSNRHSEMLTGYCRWEREGRREGLQRSGEHEGSGISSQCYSYSSICTSSQVGIHSSLVVILESLMYPSDWIARDEVSSYFSGAAVVLSERREGTVDEKGESSESSSPCIQSEDETEGDKSILSTPIPLATWYSSIFNPCYISVNDNSAISR